MLDRLIDDEIAPRASEIDRTGCFPGDLYLRLGDLGLLGLWTPPEHGGSGPDPVTPLLIAERLARASVALAVTYSNCGDCIAPILAGGSERVKRTWLGVLCSGEVVPAFCLSEPAGGSDVATLTTTAVRDGDHYVVTGRKAWITSAPVASLFVVFARTDPTAGHRGISAFVVPREVRGLVVGQPEDLLGLRGSPTAEVAFDEVRVPIDARLGGEGDGFGLAMTTLDESRLAIAAVSLGAATAAIDRAVTYARERVQFGRPIIEHQGLQFRLSELATELAMCRSLWQTAVAVLVGQGGRQAGVYAAMAKLAASDLAMTAAIEAAQVLGASGLTRGSGVERLIRDCKALQIFEGTNEIQKWLIGRRLQKDGLRLCEIDEPWL